MAFVPIEKLNNPITALPDRVTGRAEFVKQYFDRNSQQLLEAFNALVAELNQKNVATTIGAIRYGDETTRFIRIGSENRVEVSADGVTWTQPIAGHTIYSNGAELPQRNALAFPGATVTDNGETIEVDFPDGLKGYTPQKGVDYWTEADKQEIYDDVKEELVGVPTLLSGELLPTGANLNEYTSVGKSYFATAAVAAGLVNAPTAAAFRLEIADDEAAAGVVTQRAVEIATGYKHIRAFNVAGSTWSGWTTIKGADGYTPQKGTDYWTTADRAAMVQDVLNALPNANGVSF